MHLSVWFCFLVLGSNYLLPFNTLMNSFSYLDSSKLPYSPQVTITVLNLIYQITSIATNAAYARRGCLYVQNEYRVALAAIATSTLCQFALGVAAYYSVSGQLLFVVLVFISGITSITQSITDAVNLHYVQLYDKHSILFYLLGINVSGTIHAIILLLLRCTLTTDNRNVFISYYAITALLLAFGGGTYALKLRKNQPSSPNEGEAADRIVWRPALGHMIVCCLSFVLTLFAYPALLLKSNPPFPLYNEVCVFLLFNALALGGNLSLLLKPTRNLFSMSLILASRAIFCLPLLIGFYILGVNLFYYQHLWYIVLFILAYFAFTSGYLASGLFYAAPLTVEGTPSKVLILRLLNVSLSIGLLIGSLCSLIFVSLI